MEVGSVGGGGGEVELFAGEASPAPPSLDETLTIIQYMTHDMQQLINTVD